MAKKLSETGTTVPRYLFTSSGCFCSASEIGMNRTPALASSSLNVVATETEFEHRIDRNPAVAVAALALRALNALQYLNLAQRNAELLIGLENFRIDLVERLRALLLLGGGVIINTLIVDRPVGHPRPTRFLHGQPATIGVEPPIQHPLRLILFGRDETDGVFVEPLGSLLGFDDGLEPILILVDVDAANLLDGLLYGRHSSLRCGFKDRGLDRSVMVVARSLWLAFTLA